MASRPQGYGLSRELALKTAGKYSDSDEVSLNFVLKITNENSVRDYCLVSISWHLKWSGQPRNGRIPRVAKIGAYTLRFDEQFGAWFNKKS